jgi:hypothetical protein
VAELKVRLLPVFGAWSPVAVVTKTGKQVVSVDSSATGIVEVLIEFVDAAVIRP